jgi:hypothetical protein
MADIEPIDVFISSTCRDLVDLRAHLKSYLEEHRMKVRISEDPTSAFFVEPTERSIQICLHNVEAAKVIVCVIDRLYGERFTHASYTNISATHMEIERAIELGKPVFCFIREAAYSDFDRLKNGEKPKWVYADDRTGITSLFERIAGHPDHRGKSNWWDSFRSVIDLAPLVRDRIVRKFPSYAGSLAMAPDRLLRLAFNCTDYARGPNGGNFVKGVLMNVGNGPAFRIFHGWGNGSEGQPMGSERFRYHIGGISQGGALQIDYPIHGTPAKLFCEYENRFRDRYRIELLVRIPTQGGPMCFGDDEFYIAQGDAALPRWTLVK